MKNKLQKTAAHRFNCYPYVKPLHNSTILFGYVHVLCFLCECVNEMCADWQPCVCNLKEAILLYKGTPVVTARCMLGFLPQRVKCTHSLAHRDTHRKTHSTYMHMVDA